ncbi:MAG: hypothetical protein HY302_14955 [Opitutae bacterium]|nr:hypothetical protein [Opitutae bacterium]
MFARLVSLLFIGCPLLCPAARAAPLWPESVRLAGNAAEEGERVAVLRRLAAAPELAAAPRAELLALLPVAEAWAEGRARAAARVARGADETHRYLNDFFTTPTRGFAPPFPAEPAAASPLHPLWAFYRGRFLAWCLLEYAEVMYVPEKKAAFVAEADRCFAEARAAFPDNPLLRIYPGENQPWPGAVAAGARAPAWANSQRRALEHLHEIIRWWITERQLANGEFGGAWGDDVEMWRWWAPVLIGFADPAVTAAQELLAGGNLRRPGLAAGYTRELTDVEHTAEETADTITPMLLLRPADPAWAARARRLVALAEEVWWAPNARGALQFKHLDFNFQRVGPDATRAYATAMHGRVLQPVLLLWQRTRDPALGAPLTRWLRTWAEAALGTDNGKPAGLVPAALRWPDGLVGSERRGWIGPDLGDDPMTGIYSWPHQPVGHLATALLLAHDLTGETIFLEPLLRMAEFRRAHLGRGDPDGPEGSVAWAGRRLGGVIADALAKWRQLHGDARFDDLLLADAGGYVRFRLTGDETALAGELARTADQLSFNRPMFTTENRFTDRVLAFNLRWPATAASFPATPQIDTDLLYSMVTGDLGGVEYYPLNAVRWLAEPRDLAVRVLAADARHFTAEIFSFRAEPRPLRAQLLLLQGGAYRLTITPAAGPEQSVPFTLATADPFLEVVVPPRTLLRVALTPLN